MKSKLNLIIAACTLQRVVAGLVFVPLLAYTFPPFLDVALPFGMRLTFWAGVMALAIAATWLSRKFIYEHLSQDYLSARDVVFSAVILILFTPALWLLAWLLFTIGGQEAPGALAVLPYGVLFSTGLILVGRTEPGHPKPTGLPEQMPRLVRRLPAGFQGRIYRLTVRDHNVDVVTSEGTFTIRSRFTDAIDEMEPIPGHCTHRSHWVTDDAIVSTERTDGKTFVRLRNGDLVPVSRKYRPMLEQDGLI